MTEEARNYCQENFGIDLRDVLAESGKTAADSPAIATAKSAITNDMASMTALTGDTKKGDEASPISAGFNAAGNFNAAAYPSGATSGVDKIVNQYWWVGALTAICFGFLFL